ncbi:hypothetical protein EZV62_000781 [Acer yangbiense]|uniref:Nop domain-containing protein n=1 Tax=Acer yangbiense TaxID=1000413 RepID=A0A5C7IUK3_9ROSI|nr:hypothetical protein EZV62_000781 [Acer yangbiense]
MMSPQQQPPLSGFSFDDLDDLIMEDDVDHDHEGARNCDDELDSVSHLFKTQKYSDIMHNLEVAFQRESNDNDYQLIVDCNALSVDIDNEIVAVHNFIRDKYRLKFAELESIIGNEMDLTLVNLEGLLPSVTIMLVSIMASTTTGKPLPENVLEETIDACDRVFALDSAKKRVLDFLEGRMGYIAPNLSAVAAKLIRIAGGVSELANMPACNVQLLGAKKTDRVWFSNTMSLFRIGYLEQTEAFQATPPYLRSRACRLLAAKSTLAVRVDSARGDTSGSVGRALRGDFYNKIEKWQEPPPAKLCKPLPVPDSQPKKKKRGGRRSRKMKERYAMTDMRKMTNRMLFGAPEESYLGAGYGNGYGMLGRVGFGKLRLSVTRRKLSVAKKLSKGRG